MNIDENKASLVFSEVNKLPKHKTMHHKNTMSSKRLIKKKEAQAMIFADG